MQRWAQRGGRDRRFYMPHSCPQSQQWLQWNFVPLRGQPLAYMSHARWKRWRSNWIQSYLYFFIQKFENLQFMFIFTEASFGQLQPFAFYCSFSCFMVSLLYHAALNKWSCLTIHDLALLPHSLQLSSIKQARKTPASIGSYVEYSELEGTRNDNWVQLLAPHRTT